jgi:hypothetical protein
MIEDPFLALTVGGIAALTIVLVVAVSIVLWIISAKRSIAEARRGPGMNQRVALADLHDPDQREALVTGGFPERDICRPEDPDLPER